MRRACLKVRKLTSAHFNHAQNKLLPTATPLHVSKKKKKEITHFLALLLFPCTSVEHVWVVKSAVPGSEEASCLCLVPVLVCVLNRRLFQEHLRKNKEQTGNDKEIRTFSGGGGGGGVQMDPLASPNATLPAM